MSEELRTALILSTVGLGVGPALAALGRRKDVVTSLIDGLTLGIFPLVLMLRILPHAAENLGGSAVVLAVAGFVAMWLADRHGHRAATIGPSVVLPALVVHALADGISLAAAVRGAHGPDPQDGLFLWALLLHRLPEGLFVVMTLREGLGWPRALVALAALAVATLLGALCGDRTLTLLPMGASSALIAFGAGVMLRLVVHSHATGSHPQRPIARALAGGGFLAGIACALILPSPHDLLRAAQSRELSLVQSLIPLFVETAPSLLVGLVATGVLHAFAPRHLASWLRGGSSLWQAARGLVFGLPLPICSCGILPLLRRFLAQGVPVAAVVAFAIGTPELGVDSAFMSIRLLGVPLTVARIAASVAIAFVAALWVARVTRARAASRSVLSASLKAVEPAAPPATFNARTRAALREAFVHSPAHVVPWYVLGLLAAAIFEAAVDPRLLTQVAAPFDVLVALLLALPGYVCAQGATPLGSVMAHKGFSVGAVLVFLIVGPGTNLAVVGVLRKALGWRAALTFVGAIIGGALVSGFAANWLVPRASLPAIHPLVEHRHLLIEWMCAVTLAALAVVSLVRVGPRRWFGAISFSGDEHPAHSHDQPVKDQSVAVL